MDQAEPQYGINWPVVVRYVLYAAIVGALLLMASLVIAQVRSR